MVVEWPEMPDEDIVSALPIDEAESSVLTCSSSDCELTEAVR